jgi:hypothetical protein
MSTNFVASTQKTPRTSRIHVEVKEIAVPANSRNITAQLNSDADGSDLTNE